jgi:glyoxylase-like metal-dependent hydrolase (beta-lactamase superfamily II)
MRVHRLTCASHRGLLLETSASLVLVDPGYGLRDVAEPTDRLSSAHLRTSRPRLRNDRTAARQVKRLGFDPRDVRHVILSHLDCDRAGGLDDFPEATVHLFDAEVRAATAQKSSLDRIRYRPQQWTSRDRWRAYPSGGDTLWGFQGVRRPAGLLPEVLMVPLPGHTPGHAGVAVRSSTGWLLYAGDAYYFHGELDERPTCPPGTRLAQWLLERDRGARLETQRRLRELVRDAHDLTVICAHDEVPSCSAPRGASVPVPYQDVSSGRAMLVAA